MNIRSNIAASESSGFDRCAIAFFRTVLLLVSAITGLIGSAFNRFHSFFRRNKVMALEQVPVAEDLNRGSAKLVPILYHGQAFPASIRAELMEVTAHFDVKGTVANSAFCLHTDHAGKRRKFNAPALEGLDEIKKSHRYGVPCLWVGERWGVEMAEFLFRLVGAGSAPSIVEIHPPYIDSVPSLEAFFESYGPFERALLARWPSCRIEIENRYGTKHPKPFLVSNLASILALVEGLRKTGLQLGVALDLPQLFSAEFGPRHLVGVEGEAVIRALEPIRDRINAIHIWGRGPMGGAHSGDFDGLFDPATPAKARCLGALNVVLADGRDRHLLIELRGRTSKVGNILADLAEAGFKL